MRPGHDILIRIKRAILAGRYEFSEKAREEMRQDGLTALDVAEAIFRAQAVNKVLRSTSPYREQRRELLYVINGCTLGGVLLYTKGKFRTIDGLDYFYFLISAKRAI